MNTDKIPQIDWTRVDKLIQMAFDEDLGALCDVTSESVIPDGVTASAVLLCKEENCVCAGLPVAERVFKTIDPDMIFTPKVREGELCTKGTVMAEIKGSAKAILTAERTALNFIQRLCGVASASKLYAEAVKASSTVILDTRKTTPGWRNLEKYAVAVGGASNHRIGLFDRVLIKDNHRELAGLEGPGGIKRSVEKAKAKYPALEVEVEADSLEDVREAADAGADHILLDNMSNEQMAESVKINRGRAKLEASGGITIARIPSIAALGVDFISVGALTHSVKSSDISLDIKL